MTKLSLRADHIEQAKAQSVVDGKPWLLVLQEHGDEPYVVMPFSWFVSTLHPLYAKTRQTFWCGANTPETCGTQCSRCACEHPS